MKNRGTARSIATAIGAIALVVLPVLSGQAQDPITAQDFTLPPQDAGGWSVLTTSTDTRLVYVDPVNGVDTTGTYYSPTAIGGNPQSPNSNMTKPFKTISAAFAKTRASMPDWILLKSGGTFNESLTIRFGRSTSERYVACAYGTGARPVLQTGTNAGITNTQVSNAAVIGIKFYAHTRDPLNPNYVAPTSTTNGKSGFSFTNYNTTWIVRHILLEDCVFDFYTGLGLTNHQSVNPLSNFIMRRCIVSNCYSVASHSSGLWHGQDHGLTVPSVLLQENLFDHNGWIEGGAPGSGATIFNHNTYFYGTRGVVFERNFFLRASSIGNKWTAHTSGSNTYPSDKIVIADNLYAEGELGISLGANYVGAYRFQNVMVRDNVMTDIGRSRPTNRSLAWYMTIQDWQHGDFAGNLLIHQRSSTLAGNAFAILFNGGAPEAPTASDDVVVSGNVVGDFMSSTATSNALVRFGSGSLMTSSTFANNITQSPTASPLASISSLGGFHFAGTNVYSSTAITTKQFVKSGTVFTDLAGWKAYTGDNGATTTAPVFADPGRDLEHYLPAVGLSGTTFQAFISALKGQSKANWNPALTANAVNNWLRAGYNMPSIGAELLHYTFNEGSGTTVNDSAGNHTTTVTGAKWTTLGKFGGAYNDLTGTSSKPVAFNIANQTDLNFNPQTDDFTISFWVKIGSTVPTAYWTFVAKYHTSPSTNFQYMLWIPNNMSRLGAYVGNQAASYALPAAINNDQWHLITLTNGTVGGVKKFTMYFDDGAGAKASAPVTTGAGGLTTGSCRVYAGIGSGGVGQMDDFRVLKRAISQAEVALIYNGTFVP